MNKNKMDTGWVFLVMWKALYRVFEELPEEVKCSDDEMFGGLSGWVTTCNPYNMLDHRPIDGSDSDFAKHALERFGKSSFDAAESYELAKSYLEDNFDWSRRFEEVGIDEWKNLFKLVSEEETNRVVDHVRWSGPMWGEWDVIGGLEGKVLKSVECRKLPGEDAAWSNLRLNLGRSSVDLALEAEDLLGREVADFAVRAAEPGESFVPAAGGQPRLYLVGERVAHIEVVRFAASLGGAALESSPEDGYDFEPMPGQHMAIVLHLRGGGVRAFYRCGPVDGAIRMADHIPTDDELGLEEFRAFWSKPSLPAEVRRDSLWS